MRHHTLIILCCALLLAGCSYVVAPPTPTPEPPASPTPTPSPTPRLPGAQGALNRVLQRQSLLIGLLPQAQAPFVLPATEAGPNGLDIMLAETLAREWTGRANALAWRIDASPADLAAGRVDLLMGGLIHTRAAEAEIDFSQTYWLQDGQPVAIGVASNDSLMRDSVNLSLQEMVSGGEWQALVQTATGAEPIFTPERWLPPYPDIATLSARSHPIPEASRLQAGRVLRIAYLQDNVFSSDVAGDSASGYLPDLARELSRRLSGSAQPQLRAYLQPPTLDFTAFDIYLGPLVHSWEQESRVDFSQTFYADGLALVARPGSNVTRLDQLHHRPLALLQTPSSSALYAAALAELGVEPILYPVATPEEAIPLLLDNKVDAILVQGYPAARMVAARIPDAILAPGRQGPTLPLAFALPANDSSLRDAVNFALQDMASDGFLAKLHSQYFGGDPPYPIELWPQQ